MRFRRSTLFLAAMGTTWILAIGPLQAHALAPLTGSSAKVGPQSTKTVTESSKKQTIQTIQGTRKTTREPTPKNVIIMLDDTPRAEQSATPKGKEQ